MNAVILTALGVGGATVIGALIGFLFKNPSHRLNDMILSFAAGVMLAAAVIGLIIPSLEQGGKLSILVTVVGIFCGALCLNLIDKLVPHLHKITGMGTEENHPQKTAQLNKVLLFVIAIAIHNLPEGIAAGVSFGSGDMAQAVTVAGGIALQNIPEGMVIIAPMLASGMKRGRTFVIALMTGIVEVLGTFIGYFAVSISSAILPFALAFAGGTMLYVISDEMIPETHSHGSERAATYTLLAGFSVMLIFDFLLG
ncbi:MAG: ZIP family metal transporter [Ruminococcaceae bacterium]|nr:ZIP family metal transporter [Oscillospiraceae bacterium]